MDGKYRRPIEALVRQRAAGRFEQLVHSGQMASHAMEPIAALIMRSGQNLVPLPTDWWKDLGTVMFPVHEPGGWCVVLPLRTEGGGRGRLSLEVELYVHVSDIRAEIENAFLPPATTS